MSILNFQSDKISFTFSKDMFKFINDLFYKNNFYKINFNVVIGNPAEKIYDKMIKKWNGRIVGVHEKEIMLIDGKIYDKKMYELMREDYIKVEKEIK